MEEALKKAQEAALTAAKYGAIVELVGIDVSGYTAEQMELVDAALATAREAVAAAETVEEVEAALAVAKEAILAAGKMVCASDLFRDVSENAWYHKGVDFVVRNGYMEGMGNGIFGVNAAITRGQMVTILYRMEGKPSVEGLENVFTDVADGKFYTDAVIWAASEGIVEGNGDGILQPQRRHYPGAAGYHPVSLRRKAGCDRGRPGRLPRWQERFPICCGGHELGSVQMD